jgi:hypothetical protein
MKLSTARLCLDCEEVHDAQVCPVCASETFSYLSRWIPIPEPRIQRPREAAPQVEVYRQLIDADNPPPSRRGRLLKQGAIGLTAVGVFGWLWRSSRTRTPDGRDDRA